MADATLTTYDAVIRELWPQARINNVCFDDAPFLGMVPKKTDFDEKIRHIALQYGPPTGRSAGFSTAQGNAGSSKFKDFDMTRVSDYGVGTIDGETLEATKSKKAAIVSTLENEIKGVMSELSRSMHKHLYRNGTGSLAQAGTISTVTLTLSNIEDIVNFEVGQELVASTADGGTLRSGSATITGVDRDLGTLTTDSNWTSQITSFVITDFMYIEGDAAATGDSKMISGLDAWLPAAPPTSTAFFGVDRTDDVVRLGGVRYDGSSDGSIKECLMQAAARLRREGKGARPDVGLINPQDLGDLLVELEGSVERGNVPGKLAAGKASFGFDSVVLKTTAGSIDLVADYECPRGVAYLLRMDTWCLATLGAAPRIIEHDGLRVQRQAAADGVEFRAVYRGNLYCDAPGWNCRVALPS